MNRRSCKLGIPPGFTRNRPHTQDVDFLMRYCRRCLSSLTNALFLMALELLLCLRIRRHAPGLGGPQFFPDPFLN